MSEALRSNETTSTARLLIVDDEPHVRLPIAEVLRQHGYLVEEAASGPEALTKLANQPIDLMVLDLVMPGMNGVEVIRRARQTWPDLAIIVLTAHASVESAIVAVKADVADYMLKPCNPNDLTVAIERALQARAKHLRHHRLLSMVGEVMEAMRDPEEVNVSTPLAPAASMLPATAEHSLHVGVLTLDRQKRLVTIDSDPSRTVELTEGEVAILAALMEQPNQVLSAAELAGKALGYEGMDKWTVESVVRSSVFRLRQKIEPAHDAPQLICTVRGRGYFLALN